MQIDIALKEDDYQVAGTLFSIDEDRYVLLPRQSYTCVPDIDGLALRREIVDLIKSVDFYINIREEEEISWDDMVLFGSRMTVILHLFGHEDQLTLIKLSI